jgi:hypothetical protein
MAELNTPTDQELEALTTGGTSRPAPSMPDPEPEVLERAQQILDRAADGSEDPQVTVGDQPLPGESAVHTDRSLTAGQKLAFLAHILGDQPYSRTYQLLAGRLTLTFSTISATLDSALASLASAESADRTHRRALYTNYLLAACLSRVQEGEQVSEPRIFRSDTPDLRAYQSWFNSLNREQYLVILQAFRTFRRELDLMMDKADDPDFWPTPS